MQSSVDSVWHTRSLSATSTGHGLASVRLALHLAMTACCVLVWHLTEWLQWWPRTLAPRSCTEPKSGNGPQATHHLRKAAEYGVATVEESAQGAAEHLQEGVAAARGAAQHAAELGTKKVHLNSSPLLHSHQSPLVR